MLWIFNLSLTADKIKNYIMLESYYIIVIHCCIYMYILLHMEYDIYIHMKYMKYNIDIAYTTYEIWHLHVYTTHEIWY